MMVSWPKPVAVDNSLLVSVESSHDQRHRFPIGVTWVRYTATDESGNVAVCNFSVTIHLGE